MRNNKIYGPETSSKNPVVLMVHVRCGHGRLDLRARTRFKQRTPSTGPDRTDRRCRRSFLWAPLPLPPHFDDTYATRFGLRGSPHQRTTVQVCKNRIVRRKKLSFLWDRSRKEIRRESKIKRYADVVKQDPDKARQGRETRTGTNFTPNHVTSLFFWLGRWYGLNSATIVKTRKTIQTTQKIKYL